MASLLPVGTKLKGGAFRIGKILGQGGFGITYLGADTTLGRSVAIKEFFPNGCVRQRATVHPAGAMTIVDYQDARQRFLDEARMLAKFQHSGIVQVFASFEENNTAYMAMELIKGRTLMSLIDERGYIPESDAVGYISRAGEALAIVHAANLLHRDIKPENLMVAEGGRVVLLDFGTAREFASGKTKRMTAIVTPGYAPLEQYGQQAKFGIYTDVYALAATLYHALTGEVPVQATDRASGVELPAPHRRVKGLSRSVNDAVMWAMEMKATARPQSVREFLDALVGGIVSATVVDDADQTAPQRHRSPHHARIQELVDELRRPTAAAPPTSVDARISHLRQEIARYTAFMPPQPPACPGCNSPLLARLTGEWTGRCPVCRAGNMTARQMDEDLCPVCATGRLTRQRLEQPTVFCPVCRGMPLIQEKRKKFGIPLDLWWTCSGCKAEFDVLIGGRAKLVSFANDPFGFGAKHIGQTFPVESWQQCAPVSQSRRSCARCAAAFYEFDHGIMVLVGFQRDPRGVARKCLGKPYARLGFVKLANNVASNTGNRYCPNCRAEFDLEPVAKSLTIVASNVQAYRWTADWHGKPRTLREWSFVTAGKQSLNPGWLCWKCKTEFDEVGDTLTLIATSVATLSRQIGQQLPFEDWHRQSRGAPTTAKWQELDAEAAKLESIRLGELKGYHDQVQRRQRAIETELATLFKHCLLDGSVGDSDSAPRLRDGEVVRWQSAALKLKERSSQGVPYWDNDGDGILYVSSNRILFDASVGGRWERPLTKLNHVHHEYVRGQAILVTHFDGRQKPIGFMVPDQDMDVTIAGHTCRVTLGIADLLSILA